MVGVTDVVVGAAVKWGSRSIFLSDPVDFSSLSMDLLSSSSLLLPDSVVFFSRNLLHDHYLV